MPVKFDPQNIDDAMIWADRLPDLDAQGGTAAHLSGADRASHLDALDQLKQRGLLSEEQFQQAKYGYSPTADQPAVAMTGDGASALAAEAPAVARPMVIAAAIATRRTRVTTRLSRTRARMTRP